MCLPGTPGKHMTLTLLFVNVSAFDGKNVICYTSVGFINMTYISSCFFHTPIKSG